MQTTTLAPRDLQPTGDPYLKVQLDAGTCVGLPMLAVQEVTTLPVQRLTAMPNVPAPLLGLISRRNRVLWIADLARLLGLLPLSPSAGQYHLLILKTSQTSLGFVVQSIQGITRLSSDMIHNPPGHLSSDLLFYLSGYVSQQSEFLWLLNVEAIAQSSTLQFLE